MTTIKGSFELEDGNSIKVFNDLCVILKNHPNSKISVAGEEDTYTKQ